MIRFSPDFCCKKANLGDSFFTEITNPLCSSGQSPSVQSFPGRIRTRERKCHEEVCCVAADG
ncbi:MAG: hypothetical protein ACK4TJ_09980, partial [Tabrizicola sp.]